VVLVRINVSEECVASIIIVERISELGAALALVTANIPGSLILSIMIMEAIRSSETLVLTRATWRHFSEDGILQHEDYL
jgi:hypothetical protein